MDTRLMFTAAASSVNLDSWDLENLKYLRKLSTGYQNRNGNPLSDTMEESYCETMSYQSHLHHGPMPPQIPGRSSVEITTTTASVHNGPDSLAYPEESDPNTDTVMTKAKEREDEEAINEIEEFSSFCGNTRSIPNPDTKLGENVNVHMNTSTMGEPEPFHDMTTAFEEREHEQPHSLGPRPLDTCYQLDILTIRNESVLASKYPSKIPVPKSKIKTKTKAQMSKQQPKSAIKALRNGSDGFSSSGESSELEEGNPYRDACLHAPPPSLAGGKNPRRRSSGLAGHKHKRLSSSSSPSCSSSSAYSSSSIPSTSTIATIENERTAVCPFCDGVGARLPSSSSRTYYYMGENENGNTTRDCEPSSGRQTQSPGGGGTAKGVGTEINADHDHDHDHDHTDSDPSSSSTRDRDHGLGSVSVSGSGSDSPPPLPRTPSPYYVRLRRDLITSYSPALCPPRNFGMDKQGQLVIDYSQNWLGLEKYIENLKLELEP